MQKTSHHPKPYSPHRTTATKHQPKKKFATIMAKATRTMPRPQRLFSRFIHRDAVSVISDILSSIILRPNAILAGAVMSFAFTLLTYLLAKNFGYSLSGFEAVGGFAVGWAIGLLYDIISSVIKKQ